MKKKILTLGLFVAMMVGFATQLGANCTTYVLTCGSDGSNHYVMICAANELEQEFQEDTWEELLCS
ncbi:MAG: hypothetical protein ACOCXO_02050 [Bacteroidota bacterium]